MKPGDVVEILWSPLRGMRARVVSVSRVTGRPTVQLIDGKPETAYQMGAVVQLGTGECRVTDCKAVANEKPIE